MASVSLGMLVPAKECDGLKLHVDATKPIRVWVASDNALKVNAAKKAVALWAPSTIIEAKGFAVSSDISEQPHSSDETKTGAKNRLAHLKEIVRREPTPQDVVEVFVSMENGIMPEKVEGLQNSAIFLDEAETCWIDRCFVVVDVAISTLSSTGTAFSEGVTTPVQAVKESEKSGWTKTCGSFIEKLHGFNAKDWHGQMAGKGREPIMQETILAALGGL